MLRYTDPDGVVSLSNTKVANATRTLAQSSLITTAEETGLGLNEAAYAAFNDRIDRVIAAQDIELSPSDLVRHAEALAARGAQAMIASGKGSFLSSTWNNKTIEPVWPFV